jgi:hypothetical protein
MTGEPMFPPFGPQVAQTGLDAPERTPKPPTCPYCEGEGWYIDHEDECYENGACSCSGVQRQCNCEAAA